MNAPSNPGSPNGAKPVPSPRLNGAPSGAATLAQQNQELRTPLNVIMDFTKQLELECDNENLTDSVRQILKAAHDSLEIINRQDAGENGNGAPVAIMSSQCDILHIEDNATNFASVKLLLGSKRQLKVARASDGVNGVALAETLAPRLILLDLDLPDIHGSEVIQRLQKNPATASIPVVVISGDTTPSQIERLLVLGARNYLAKPFNPHAFLAVIDEILGDTARSTENPRRSEPTTPFVGAQRKDRPR